MSSPSERRTLPDRRRAARGGRRPADLPGFAPLVLVVGAGREPARESETILARLNFAVAPIADAGEARRVIGSLKPDVIVARPEDAAALRGEAGAGVPVVESPAGADGEVLIRSVRDAIRRARAAGR